MYCLRCEDDPFQGTPFQVRLHHGRVHDGVVLMLSEEDYYDRRSA